MDDGVGGAEIVGARAPSSAILVFAQDLVSGKVGMIPGLLTWFLPNMRSEER